MKKVIFMDCGDTLVDESTQIFNEDGIVTDVKFYDDADKVLFKLKELGYIVILVADGKDKSFRNIFNKINFLEKFDGFVVSENVGRLKPHPAMFEAAFELVPKEYRSKDNILMVGNNLRRDIKGANNFGITSVWMNWSPRYFHELSEPDLRPDYEIKSPKELIELTKKL